LIGTILKTRYEGGRRERGGGGVRRKEEGAEGDMIDFTVDPVSEYIKVIELNPWCEGKERRRAEEGEEGT
jgi:hypothetical protein